LSNNALSHMQSGDLDGAEQLLLAAAQAGGDYPRISSNLALVQSLKASRGARNGGTIRAAVAASATGEPQPAAAEWSDVLAIQAAILAAGPNEEPAVSPDPAPSVAGVVEPAVERLALPEPADRPTDMAPRAHAPLLATRAESLASDPTVYMQAIPKDPQAGLIARKKPAVRPRAVANKAEGEAAKKTPDTSDTILRPALVEASAGQ
jgi:hypothetical protein